MDLDCQRVCVCGCVCVCMSDMLYMYECVYMCYAASRSETCNLSHYEAINAVQMFGYSHLHHYVYST